MIKKNKLLKLLTIWTKVIVKSEATNLRLKKNRAH